MGMRAGASTPSTSAPLGSGGEQGSPARPGCVMDCRCNQWQAASATPSPHWYPREKVLVCSDLFTPAAGANCGHVPHPCARRVASLGGNCIRMWRVCSRKAKAGGLSKLWNYTGAGLESICYLLIKPSPKERWRLCFQTALKFPSLYDDLKKDYMYIKEVL